MQLQVKCNERSWTFKKPLTELTIKKIVKRLPYRIVNLPNSFTLQYEDFDGDMIDVTCDADLQTIRECQLDNKIRIEYKYETLLLYKKLKSEDLRKNKDVIEERTEKNILSNLQTRRQWNQSQRLLDR